MGFERLEDFYRVYGEHRTYVRAEVVRKHIRNFDEQFWDPAQARTDHTILDLGCGVGLFLAYLQAKGVQDVLGIDGDAKVKAYMPPEVAEKVVIGDIWETLAATTKRFDRIALFDVFEHFDPIEGRRLLVELTSKLKPDGRIVLRVPNAASPWGLQYQYNDVTHKAAYGPGSLQHVALAAGLKTVARLDARRGGRLRRLAEDMLHGALNRILTDPPPLWGANMVVVLAAA
ncbi:MAG: class I SAM-dependent methyltransferase [Magnetospirillum sp.]|nr:class I SAM-dependent methyltransferase [Magnetospirillum sp.]